MAKDKLLTLGLGLALAAFLGLGLWFGPELSSTGDHTLPLSACNLNHGACSTALPGGGHLTVELGPRPIPVLKPIAIRVDVEGWQARAVKVEFSGVDMDMGYNQTTLRPEATGRFMGQGSLPVCITGRMTWQASFILEGKGGTLLVPFRFDTGS